MEKTTYTLNEAAELLRCHKETLRRSIHSGELYAAKLGKSYRLSRKDLESFWQARGGGSLFEDSPPPEQPPAKKQSRKKPSGPEQLKLPT